MFSFSGLPGVLNWQLVFVFIFVLISHDNESRKAAVICWAECAPGSVIWREVAAVCVSFPWEDLGCGGVGLGGVPWCFQSQARNSGL